jgi:hypothetical protein
MEDKESLEKMFESAEKVKEQLVYKEETPPKDENLKEEANEFLKLVEKLKELEEQIRKQKGLLYKFGIKKENSTLNEEYKQRLDVYLNMVNSFKERGLQKKDILEIAKEGELKKIEEHINDSKEENQKKAENISPEKTKFWDKLKGLLFKSNKAVVENKEEPQKTESQEFIEKYNIDPDNWSRTANFRLKEEIQEPEEPQKIEEIRDAEESEEIQEHYFGQYGNKDEMEEQRRRQEDQEEAKIEMFDRLNVPSEEVARAKFRKLRDLNKKEVKKEMFNVVDVPNEEEVKIKFEEIKKEDEKKKELEEEGMDRPNI